MNELERMEMQVFESRAAAERDVAREIAGLVRRRPDAVLGLATGNTPTGVYAELARLRREEGLDLSRVRTFNLDEYCGLAPTNPRSFRAWMERELFVPAGIALDRVCFPDGFEAGHPVRVEELPRVCDAFERAIRDAGGIDLQLLGIGRNGHIGFNEPGSTRASRTRRVELHPWTREDAAAEFGGLEHVPTHAITMGVATILEARAVRVLAFGAKKRALVRRTLDTANDPAWPASFLCAHAGVRLVVDREAAT
ncbi:MAG: glucosamine-6-phosphate deaminase [Planctomycetes bacterium]|nr:glucosamine-6-phosphate deaminase [Planctomycetota bacterium]